jgi:hypothetical protein
MSDEDELQAALAALPAAFAEFKELGRRVEARASPSFGSRLSAWRTTGGLAGWKPRKFELWLKRTSLYS